MATKTARKAATALPPGLYPLLTQAQLQELYQVSQWTVRQWLDAGMPWVPMAAAKTTASGERTHRRFDLAQVQQWHAAQADAALTA